MSSEWSTARSSSWRVLTYDHAPTEIVAVAANVISARMILSRRLIDSVRSGGVTHAADGVDQLGLARLLQLATEVGDVHREVLRVRAEVVAPDPLVDRRVVQHDALVAHQQFEQVELGLGQLDL